MNTFFAFIKSFILILLFIPSICLAATLTVSSTADSGAGTLRQALIDANANCSGDDKIVFNIPTTNATLGGVNYYLIQLATPLPIVQCRVNIDGLSQPGATAGAPLIELNGSSLSSTIVAPSVTSSGYPAGLLLVGRDRVSGVPLSTTPNGSEIKGLIINRFPLHGIYLYGANDVKIKGNFLGVDVTGERAGFANGRTNIILEGAQNNQIIDRNIIGSSVLHGIQMIYLNQVGFHPQSYGACVGCGTFNTIGASQNVIQNNYIGLNKEGNCSIGGFRSNGAAGVPGACQPDGTRAPGGVDPAAVYSTNNGIIIERGIGNTFTDLSTALSAAHNKNNLIGGLEVGQGNVIAGARSVGTVLHGPLNKVQGNIYGLRADASSKTNIPVTQQAQVSDAAHGYVNVIENNIISNAGLAGIALIELGYHPGPRDITIKGNHIGTNKQNASLGNGNHGVFVGADSADVLVIENTIANNAGFGLSVRPRIDATGTYTPTGVTILSNSIHNNGKLGIDLNSLTFISVPTDVNTDGPNLNDNGDADGGPNRLQNHPTINGEKSFINPSLVQVWGTLDSKPNQEYLIQVFANVLADPSGYGEGQVYVGSIRVHTDNNGHADFHLPAAINAPIVNGVKAAILSATATDMLTGDTSEFSPSVNVDAKGSPTAYENVNSEADAHNWEIIDFFDFPNN